ncbi:hypothetical protein MKX01_041834 [Papaver californicum]|nr:hypothetical protein MKX01_041834 [Papaver californicum]
MYLILAFILIHLPATVICQLIAVLEKKYLLEAYFIKHDILIDSNFHSFLKHYFPLRSCKSLDNLNSVIKVLVLHRDLKGEGSHPRLFSSLRVSIQPDANVSELPTHFCEAIVIERLPSGVFADPFELQHLVQRGVFVDAAVFGDTNLELPSALSSRSVVEVHIDISHNILLKHTEELEIHLELPLHARYPKSSGNKAHSQLVSYVTFTAAFVSTLLIVLAAIYYSANTNSSNKL